MNIIYISSTFVLLLFISGCTSLKGCPDEDILKQAGVCADPFFISANKKKIDAISYPGLIYKDGRYYLEGEYKKTIHDENARAKRNHDIEGKE